MMVRPWRLAVVLSLAIGVGIGQFTLVFGDQPPAPPKDKPNAPAQPVETKPASKPTAPKTGAPKPDAKQPADDKQATQDKARRQAEAEYYELYKVLADTMFQVEQNYVKEVDRRELMEAAIRGVLDKLDPYSNYISPEEINQFKTSVENQFGGIGIQASIERGQLRVLSPLVGSPAYRAGLQSGDAVVEIDGKPTSEMKLDDAVKLLRGEPGTSVKLTVIHASTGKNDPGKRESVSLKREIIHVETVMGDSRKLDDTWNFMFDADKKIVHKVQEWEIVRNVDGSEREKRPRKAAVPNTATETPLKWSGKLMKKAEVFNRFVSSSKTLRRLSENAKPIPRRR